MSIVYLNGKYTDSSAAAISPDDRGFVFSDGIYEVIRYYNGKPFRFDDHISRLMSGAEFMRFDTSVFPDFRAVGMELSERNSLENCGSRLLYIQVTRGTAPRSHAFPSAGTAMTVYATVKPFESDRSAQSRGVNIMTVHDNRWERCDIKTTMLIPNVLAKQKARESGFYDAVFIRNGVVTEGTHINVFAVIDGTLRTHPADNRILGGVTRKEVIEICTALNIPCAEKEFSYDEMLNATEIFLSGTTAEITPVIEVDWNRIADGNPGGITTAILSEFLKITGMD